MGVVALWVLGITATVPAGWPVWPLVVAAVLSAIVTTVYAIRAIAERRSGNSHYFTMALITVVLTVVSLAASAVQLQGGPRFLMSIAAIFAFVFLVAVYFKHGRRPPSTAA